MSFEIRNIGLTIVHQAELEHKLDVVFVHGLFGHPERTWSRKTDADPGSEEPTPKKARKNARTEARNIHWPRDLLPKICPQARVMTWGYDVQIERVFASSSQSTIFEHSDTLLQDLVGYRQTSAAKLKP